MTLDGNLVLNLRRLNPWWEGKPTPKLPETRRHLVGGIHRRLDRPLAPIVLVRGPRQIGKTTAQLHVIQDLLSRGIAPTRIFRVQFDELEEIVSLKEPILRIVDWYEDAVLRSTLNEAAHRGEEAYLFFDEVQNLPQWETQLKFLADASTARFVVTGSSALRIEQGRDSLAGRISTVEASVLTLTEIAEFHQMSPPAPFLEENGLQPLLRKDFWLSLREHGRRHAAVRDRAFELFSDRGGYPLAHRSENIEWGQIADQLNENVIKRVIQHDLRVGQRGRKRDAALLEEVFRLACRYVGQSPAPHMLARECQRTLKANVGPQRVTSYLRFLDSTLLLRMIAPLEIRLKRKKGHPKICLADHGLRASWLEEQVPLTPDRLATEPDLASLAGRVAESVAGVTLSAIRGLDLAHVPAREDQPEIDYVITVGTHRIPVELKYQKRLNSLADTEGLRTFLEKSANNAPFAILVTQSDQLDVDDPRVVALPLSSLMLLR